MNKQEDILNKSFQSCNINFLIGAGASIPAIDGLGNLEEELKNLDNSENEKKLNEFIKKILKSNSKLYNNKDDITKKTENNYNSFIKSLVIMLLNRKNTLILPNINIFTTNYDLFLENACENILQEPNIHFNYNDGFINKNNIFIKSIFDISEYYKIISYKSKIDYTASYIPNINIVKLHGSINWKIEKDNIIYNNLQNEINDYNNIGIVLPTDEKFKSTVINRIYYSSLRYFSAELERENTFLFAFGFSFRDEHINDIIKQALKTNYSLQLFINSYNNEEYKRLKNVFNNYVNVQYLNADKFKNIRHNKYDFEYINKELNNIVKDLQNE